MPKYLLLCVLSLYCFSCNVKDEGDKKAKTIINKCIEAHGGSNYQSMNVSFDFRQFKVRLQQNDGKYLYERTSIDSFHNILHDVITNDTFYHEVNGDTVALSPKDTNKFKEGLNAVAYFALLPYKLSEPAVIPQYLGESTINDQRYHKIAVSFKAEGGGKDHEDKFCYWINQKTNTMDYFAYSNGGPRFRKAIKQTKVGGVVFQDYDNYEILDSTIATSAYDEAFRTGKAKLLSKIEQHNYEQHLEKIK